MIASRSPMLCSSSTTRTLTSGMRGDGEGEGGAGARPTLHVDLAAVLLDDAVHEGHAQAAAIGLGREERLEDLGQVAGVDAFAAVARAQHEVAARDCGGHP